MTTVLKTSRKAFSCKSQKVKLVNPLKVVDLVAFPCPFHTCLKFIACLSPTGEALTQSSLLEADGEHMTTAVEPMNLHHAMLRSPGGCLHMYGRENPIHTKRYLTIQ